MYSLKYYKFKWSIRCYEFLKQYFGCHFNWQVIIFNKPAQRFRVIWLCIVNDTRRCKPTGDFSIFQFPFWQSRWPGDGSRGPLQLSIPIITSDTDYRTHSCYTAVLWSCSWRSGNTEKLQLYRAVRFSTRRSNIRIKWNAHFQKIKIRHVTCRFLSAPDSSFFCSVVSHPGKIYFPYNRIIFAFPLWRPITFWSFSNFPVKCAGHAIACFWYAKPMEKIRSQLGNV